MCLPPLEGFGEGFGSWRGTCRRNQKSHRFIDDRKATTSIMIPGVFGRKWPAVFMVLHPLPSSLGGCDSCQQPFRRLHLADKGIGSCIQDCLTCLRSPTEHDHVQVVTDAA